MTNAMPVLVREEPARHLDHDGLWKKVITDLFEPFMLFFAPDLYEQMDWSKQPDSLEQELKRTFPVKKGTKYTDKLMKVHLQDGKEQWILVHVEVQRDKEDDFAERMFQYFYRIFDKYNQKIYAIALLTDADRSFHPTSYDYHFHGTNLTYAYNTYKIWREDEETLLHSNNPFALVVLAGKYALKSEKNADDRYQFKRRLFDLIIRHKNYSRENTTSLILFVDFLLAMPEEMDQKLQGEFSSKVEEEVSLMHDTSFPDPPTFKPVFEKLRREEEEIKRQNTKEIAEVMLEKGYSAQEIIEITNITEDELEEIKNQN
ncbi:Rpn family recombination-promoting nuclease/putative transposase [Natribacillus halophilus]|uniref:Transposase (putative) YhgA-like domain-containing protein n=1 Tax=Natribacillus halophilus TaxID=549003 RepID=A0A1G8MXU1_9BACI|nr:Rpn family recombination-promoting nuclease/putative transposase [Natribacillus halophilus]SDI72772.1 conserved hypothetical protein (putative transposase or invertase) [Natribacillus halophilus]